MKKTYENHQKLDNIFFKKGVKSSKNKNKNHIKMLEK